MSDGVLGSSWIAALVSGDVSHSPGSRVRAAGAAFASNARSHNLRLAQLSFLGAWTAEWAFTVGLGIVAYRDGGATAVGLVGLLRMVPSAVIAPLAAPLADRGRRERVLVLVSTARGVATGVAAMVVGMNGPLPIVYALAALSTIAATLYRPAHSALLPSLLPDWLRTCECQCRTGASGFRSDSGGTVTGGGPFAVHQRDGRVRYGLRRLVVVGRAVVGLELPSTAKTCGSAKSASDSRGGRRYPCRSSGPGLV